MAGEYGVPEYMRTNFNKKRKQLTLDHSGGRVIKSNKQGSNNIGRV
jgi:hypothetical protein